MEVIVDNWESGSNQRKYTGFLRSTEDLVEAKDLEFVMEPIISSAHQAKFSQKKRGLVNWAALSVLKNIYNGRQRAREIKV